jgi:hypothetical protein
MTKIPTVKYKIYAPSFLMSLPRDSGGERQRGLNFILDGTDISNGKHNCRKSFGPFGRF